MGTSGVTPATGCNISPTASNRLGGIIGSRDLVNDFDEAAKTSGGTVMNRRALLRAGGVVAGVAGIGGYAAANAPTAGAVAGQPVLMGESNDAGAASTALAAATSTPTLILANSGRGAPLRLAEHTFSDWMLDAGDLINVGGELAFGHAESVVGSVYTSITASQLVPVRPFRIVDTRTAAGRANIANRSGNLDSSGRLIGGHTIDIDLSGHVYEGTAVFANLTVTEPVSSGFLTLWPSGSRPGTSSLNFAAGQTVANFCVSGLSGVDTVRLYAQRTAHVVLDVVAFAAGSPDDVNGPLLARDSASKLAGPARKPPAWRTAKNR
jgi:hypothetical protein